MPEEIYAENEKEAQLEQLEMTWEFCVLSSTVMDARDWGPGGVQLPSQPGTGSPH